MSNYKCDTCNVTLATTSKTNHLKSKKHLKNICNVVKTTPLERLQALPYICKVCNVELKATSKQLPLQSKIHEDNVRQINKPNKIETIKTKTIIKDSNDFHILQIANKRQDNIYSGIIKDSVNNPYQFLENISDVLSKKL
jgi:ribosomal protein L37AE/L43A